MCDPTMALAGQAFSGASSAVGSYYSASGQQVAMKSEAALADTNARMAELSAQTALLQGQRQEQAIRLGGSKLKGSQKAALAANGIDVSAAEAGSTVNNILSTTDIMTEIDANTAAANSIRNAWGYRAEATNLQNKALMARAGAKSINPWMAAGSTMMTSASSIAMNSYLLGKAGGNTSGKNKIIWDKPGELYGNKI